MLRSRLFFFVLLVCLALVPFGRVVATPGQPAAPTDLVFSKLGIGYNFSCAITDAGVLVCWGDNYYGQLGINNEDISYSPIPLYPTGLSGAMLNYSGGDDHACVVAADGTAWCWGIGSYGKLGNGDTEDSLVPVQVDDTTGYASAAMISAGASVTCGLTSSGAAYCWGWGYNGTLGNGANDDSSVPVAVTSLTSGTKWIEAAYDFACAVNSSNAAVCWGDNNWGTLGNNSKTDSNVPVQVSGLTSGVTQVSGGDLSACALVNGGVKCWGYGGDGALGNGSSTDSLVPVQVSGITSGATAISVGSYHACALVNGGVKCWGNNSSGQLGNNSTTQSNVPVQVIGLTSGVVAIAAGGYHTCALLNGGEIKCWGENDDGELGAGDFDDQLIPGDPVVALPGCVSGYSTYLGTKFSQAHNIYVTAHPSLQDPPVTSDVILSSEYYLLSELEDGSYYISAFLDANDSGGGPPDPGEPTAWYDANGDKVPDMITISGGANVASINIHLFDPRMLYLPLVKK